MPRNSFFLAAQLTLASTLLALASASAQVSAPDTPASPEKSSPAPSGPVPDPLAPPTLDNPSQQSPVNASDLDAVDSLARHWLGLLDDKHYGDAWDSASPVLQHVVSKNDWIKGMTAKRTPYGSVKSRILESAKPADSVGSAGIGRYLSVHYVTQFAHGPSAEVVEIVTCVEDNNGAWQVTGYGVP